MRYFAQATPGNLVILVRHGSTKLNNPSKPIVRGWKDEALSSKGRIEAAFAADRLRPYRPKYMYHSDFMRDSETAHIIANQLNLPTEADFNARTWDVGSYSGKSENIANPPIMALYKRPWERPPGSDESFNDFAARWIDFLEGRMEMAAGIRAMRPIVIVTHGRNIALAHSHISGINTWEADMPKPAKFAVIKVNEDKGLSIDMEYPTESIVDDV